MTAWKQQQKPIQDIIKHIYSPRFNLSAFAKSRFSSHPILQPTFGKRPYSASFEGGSLGDEGKGSVVMREISDAKKRKKGVITYRWNGGANAGHECRLSDGSLIVLHQFPVGILEEGTTAIVGRGMVFHLGDAIVEKDYIVKKFGRLPAKLLIDTNVGLCLDTHRALETVMNTWYLDHAGATTGNGITQAYADELYRTRITIRDLMNVEWRKKLIHHYNILEKHLAGFGFDLADMGVKSFKNSAKTFRVGSRKDFLDNLASQREELWEYFTPSLSEYLSHEWQNAESSFIFEGANGIGLHPRHGVYPDMTTSEMRSRGIQDSTEGIINYREIGGRFGIIKGPYMSSVGTRVMPGSLEAETEVKIRNAFGEFGKTTGRPRGVLPLDIPATKYWRSIGDYEYLVVTHMDAHMDEIVIVADYKNEKDESIGYRPYQWHLNTVKPEFIALPGWDGNEAKKAKKPEDLPENALKYLAFLEEALNTKIAWITTGQEKKDTISWFPN